ncbi:MAG: hypothetical protein ACT4OZ_16810 [Gemmatimonadota bacterium]
MNSGAARGKEDEEDEEDEEDATGSREGERPSTGTAQARSFVPHTTDLLRA